jgi:CRISPR/Cas system-associated exonuclease Cas4 (RecB family)
MILEGRPDRIIRSPDGEDAIIDYKSNTLPAQSKEGETLKDFQMPMYVRLVEKKHGAVRPANEQFQVSRGYFYSLKQKKYATAFGCKPWGKGSLSREDYEETLARFDMQTGEFYMRVKELNFIPYDVKKDTCIKCDYNSICRRTYSLN